MERFRMKMDCLLELVQQVELGLVAIEGDLALESVPLLKEAQKTLEDFSGHLLDLEDAHE